MNIEQKIANEVVSIILEKSGLQIGTDKVHLQKTRKEFQGDLTLVVFPYVKAMRMSPELTAETFGKHLVTRLDEVIAYNVIKGFLNLTFSEKFWLDFLLNKTLGQSIEDKKQQPDQKPVVVEFSSPNTNKPLHLGHIRNNLLGYSISKILEANGQKVVKVNLVNDRGIHICKSMLAWMLKGEGATPESLGKKGDKFVGDYYVLFESLLRKQVNELSSEQGLDEEEARIKAPLMEQARELLRRWEARDHEVVEIWKKMNGWVYEGFDKTYQRLGVSFDKTYYESETYLLGRDIVLQGLNSGILYAKADGSVWADLSEYKLDDKLLLRADGTSVYMTQDIGTAQLRYDEFDASEMIYVVGNEQNHHFDVLKKVLKKLGKNYADTIYHLSYGMVELPEGKMKSREGTVVDADDLMDEMIDTAKKTTEELGKTQDFTEEEKSLLYNMIGLGALKYFMLKVDPKRNMLFNPAESIDFNGNTGPFIQYTHARICSIRRTAGEDRMHKASDFILMSNLNEKEKRLIKTLYDYPNVVSEAAREMSPAQIANYVYELAREFNQFYHEYSILNEPDVTQSNFRLCLSDLTANTIKQGMTLLGIMVPERM